MVSDFVRFWHPCRGATSLTSLARWSVPVAPTDHRLPSFNPAGLRVGSGSSGTVGQQASEESADDGLLPQVLWVAGHRAYRLSSSTFSLSIIPGLCLVPGDSTHTPLLAAAGWAIGLDRVCHAAAGIPRYQPQLGLYDPQFGF